MMAISLERMTLGGTDPAKILSMSWPKGAWPWALLQILFPDTEIVRDLPTEKFLPFSSHPGPCVLMLPNQDLEVSSLLQLGSIQVMDSREHLACFIQSSIQIGLCML